eukprot:m.123480 g.123480  ORF g.123480 m.123480 type:complete len:338 (-) comp16252_c0_seq4:261-1274(-)
MTSTNPPAGTPPTTPSQTATPSPPPKEGRKSVHLFVQSISRTLRGRFSPGCHLAAYGGGVAIVETPAPKVKEEDKAAAPAAEAVEIRQQKYEEAKKKKEVASEGSSSGHNSAAAAAGAADDKSKTPPTILVARPLAYFPNTLSSAARLRKGQSQTVGQDSPGFYLLEGERVVGLVIYAFRSKNTLKRIQVKNLFEPIQSLAEFTERVNKLLTTINKSTGAVEVVDATGKLAEEAMKLFPVSAPFAGVAGAFTSLLTKIIEVMDKERMMSPVTLGVIGDAESVHTYSSLVGDHPFPSWMGKDSCLTIGQPFTVTLQDHKDNGKLNKEIQVKVELRITD